MKKNTKIILSLDGGGMKGYITCVILAELEKKSQKKCSDIFDLIAGTSIGGIVAALLSCGVSATDALTFFTEDGPNIFKKTFFNTIGGVFGPKYSSSVIEKVLTDKFNGLFPKTYLLMTSYDLVTQTPHFFKFDTEKYPCQLWQASRATSSAQIFFPGFKVNIAGTDYVFWDGGNVANNPAICAYAECYNLWKSDPIILSIGTGIFKTKLNADSMVNSGFISNAITTVSSLFSAGSEEVDYQLEQFIGNNYIRIQPQLDSDLAMDGVSSDDLKKLSDFSNTYVQSKECQTILNNFVKNYV
jgi:patatin-like phospholipase/acyl hydrolase